MLRLPLRAVVKANSTGRKRVRVVALGAAALVLAGCGKLDGSADSASALTAGERPAPPTPAAGPQTQPDSPPPSPPSTSPASQPPAVAPELGTTPATRPALPATQQRTSIPVKPIEQFERRGQGPINMVLIPSLGCDLTVYNDFMDRNVDRYTMLAVTLPGCGGTQPPQSPPEGVFGTWLDSAVKATWKLIQEQKIEKPVVVGHSIGGQIAMRMGLRYPEGLRAVVSLDGRPAVWVGSFKATPEDRAAYIVDLLSTYRMIMEEDWPRIMGQYVSGEVSSETNAVIVARNIGKTPRDIYLQYLADMFAVNLTNDLANIQVPLLVIAPLPTRDLPPDMVADARLYWNTVLPTSDKILRVYFERTRHFVFLDQPVAVSEAIWAFLHGQPVQGIFDEAPRPPLPPIEPPPGSEVEHDH